MTELYGAAIPLLGSVANVVVAILGHRYLRTVGLMRAIFSGFGTGLVLVFLLACLSCIHGYFIYYHLKQGATPGKRIFGLQVISLDGAPLSRGQCILREILVYFDVGFIFPGLIFGR